MALKINMALTTPDGGTVATGAILKFTTVFPEGLDKMMFNLRLFRNQAAYDAKLAEMRVNEIMMYTVTIDLLPEELPTLTFQLVQEKLKDAIEALPGIGVGKVSIVL